MRTLRTASTFELLDRLDQQLQLQRRQTERVPAADIIDHGDLYELLIELPGIDRSSLQVNATDRLLSIEAQRSAPTPASAEGTDQPQPITLVNEVAYGLCRRRFQLPNSIDRDRIEANYRDGVLRIRAAKANTRTNVPVTITID